MVDSSVARVPLGATTTNRKWFLDIDTATTGTATWIGVFGITEFTPNVEGTLQDDSDFESGGWKSEVNTANAWSNELTVKRAVTAALATAYDPGQEKLRLAAAQTGIANVVHVRWYEMEPGGPRVEAYEGRAAVQWSENGGGMDALSTVGITLTGRGARTPITHPAGP